MGWAIFALAFAAFLLTHALPVRPAVKSQIVRRIGTAGFTFGYSLLSLAMLGLLIWAAAQAPFVPLWPLSIWHKYVVLAGMLGVCILLALSVGRPNPLSFGGAKNDEFDPHRPGLVRVVRHPLLIALALWAGLHILPNGDVAHAILFAVFLGFALLGQRIIDRRKRRQMGEDVWHSLVETMKATPVWHRPHACFSLGFRLLAGILVWGVLVMAHSSLIGVSPLP